MTRLTTLLLMLLCAVGMFATDYLREAEYYQRKAESYRREAEYYQKKAQGYEREAEYYLKKAESYQREAAYYTKRGDMDRARTQTRYAEDAMDVQSVWLECRDLKCIICKF